MTHLKVLHVLYVSYVQLEMTAEKGKKQFTFSREPMCFQFCKSWGTWSIFMCRKMI